MRVADLYVANGRWHSRLQTVLAERPPALSQRNYARWKKFSWRVSTGCFQAKGEGFDESEDFWYLVVNVNVEQ